MSSKSTYSIALMAAIDAGWTAVRVARLSDRGSFRQLRRGVLSTLLPGYIRKAIGRTPGEECRPSGDGQLEARRLLRKTLFAATFVHPSLHDPRTDTDKEIVVSTRSRNASPSKQKAEAESGRFHPHWGHMPALPAVDYQAVGKKAPTVLETPYDSLPAADVVVITWTEAEWAAMVHAFTRGASSMPFSDSTTSYWTGWRKYSRALPYHHDPEWTFWGYYLLVEVEGQRVLLFKSNTHLTWPGTRYLEELINRFVDYAEPSVIFSIGTAGGLRL